MYNDTAPMTNSVPIYAYAPIASSLIVSNSLIIFIPILIAPIACLIMATSDIPLAANSDVVELEGRKMTTFPAFPYASARGDDDVYF